MSIPETMMLALQVICLAGAVFDGQKWKALYWAGAFALTLAVVKGLKT